jgi:DNA polymerase-3 subunit epsilon
VNILYFDTETTGLPNSREILTHPSQPHITQLGFILEVNGHDALVVDSLVKPDGWEIGKIASELTGITLPMCEADGIPIADAVELFVIAAENADLIVCHNTAFDTKLMGIEYLRLQPNRKPTDVLSSRPILCTMKVSTPVCRIGKKDGRTGYKWPKLEEAIRFFFNEQLENAHSAIVDIKATRRLFYKLNELGYLDEHLEKLGLGPIPHIERLAA